MRWEDERYVRVYTKDTPDWLALSWDARAVFLALLRQVDRAGILMAEKSGLRGVAGCLRAPLEVVERAIPELLLDGCLQELPTPPGPGWIIPNFLAAQEATTSDAQRKRDQRERARARALIGHMAGQDVTHRDQTSRAVTDGHAQSLCADPCRAEPTQDLAAGAVVPVGPPGAPPPAQKPRQRAQAPARAANGAPPLVLEHQTPHEPDRARQELIAAICADFAATHDGAKYKPNEKLDFKALDRMRKSHTDAEILTRCRNGFRAKYGGASYIWEVEQKWNKFATPEQTTKTAQERAAESRDTSRDWSTWDGEF